MPAKSKAAKLFRDAVINVLKSRDITISKMAEDLSMSRSSLSRVLNGHESVTIERAEKIANYLDIQLPELIAGEIFA